MATIREVSDFVYFVSWTNTNHTAANEVEIEPNKVLQKCKISYSIQSSPVIKEVSPNNRNARIVYEENVKVQVEILPEKLFESVIDLESTVIVVSKYGENQLMKFENSKWEITFPTIHRCCARGLIFDFVFMFSPKLNPFAEGEQGVLRRLLKLWENKQLSDVTFNCKEKSFGAHVAIVSSSSPVMAAMFQNDVRENNERTVEIKEMEPNTLEQLLRNMYTGKVEFDNVDVTKLLVAADMYVMESLKGQCAEYMSKTISIETATQYLILAHIHNVPNLHQTAIEYIAKNAKEISFREDWKDLIKNYPDLGITAVQSMATWQVNGPLEVLDQN